MVVVAKGRSRNPRSPKAKPFALPAPHRSRAGLQTVSVIANGAGGDGVIANVPDNGQLIGHLWLFRKVQIGQQPTDGSSEVPVYTRHPVHITRLPDLLKGIEIHLALILDELGEISADDEELGQIRSELQVWLGLEETARGAIKARLSRVNDHYDGALNPAKMEAYFQLSAARTLRDRREWINIGSTLTRLIAASNRLSKRSQQLQTILGTNISRQIIWLAPLARQQEVALRNLDQWLEGRKSLDAVGLIELKQRTNPLLWPDNLAIWHLRGQARDDVLYKPQALADFHTRMAFDSQYAWLLEPVRPVATWSLSQLAGLDDNQRRFYRSQLLERTEWLGSVLNGPYGALAQRLICQFEQICDELDRDLSSAKKSADELKNELRYRGLKGPWPAPTW